MPMKPSIKPYRASFLRKVSFLSAIISRMVDQTDGTIDRLKHYEAVLSNPNSTPKCRGITFTWSSEPDQGMYDALIKGFDRMFITPNDFMTWINGDDLLMPNALSSFKRYPLNIPTFNGLVAPPMSSTITGQFYSASVQHRLKSSARDFVTETTGTICSRRARFSKRRFGSRESMHYGVSGLPVTGISGACLPITQNTSSLLIHWVLSAEEKDSCPLTE